MPFFSLRLATLKRLAPLLLVVMMSLMALAVALAQDGTPAAPGSLDAVPAGATPVPLPTRMPKPAPSARVNGQNSSLEIYFAALEQGTAGLLHVIGDHVSGVRARFINQLADFYSMPNDGYYGLVSTDLEQSPKSYPLDVFVSYDDGTREVLHADITVTLGPFIRQNVTIGQDKAYMLDPDVERKELARLESMFSGDTLDRMWDSDGFQLPVFNELTSPFGAFRAFNGTLNTRHTGWDIRTTLGTPVMAMAGGKVIYAGPLDIRGNYVAIDHGYGIYSGYAHFSQLHVTYGETVTKGQIIGMSGDTGRTSGPHFHWEMAVNGNWVDSVDFLEMWMP
jgi:murein DD-endopeptidase MepM/ murein hydrolase activator NlpD